MKEITCNIHIHSTYSDGQGTYSVIAAAAAQAGLDVIIVTDHNIWVKGLEGYYESAGKRVLVLTGEEVHNQDRYPQKNHMLVLGAELEVATFASDPQELLDTIRQRGGLAFLAHPDEMDLKIVGETDITWVDWDVTGYSGFELWNHMSEMKTVSRTMLDLILNILIPERIATGATLATLERWDRALTTGLHLSVIGGADAHATKYKLGPISKTILPYAFHFNSINNHLLLTEPLNGDLAHDKALIYAALRNGASFIGYDLPASTHGFSFTISNEETTAAIGETLTLTRGATVQVRLPFPAQFRLIRNGQVIHQSTSLQHLAYPLVEPGAYRVECHLNFQGKTRGWIYSNPIYVVKGTVPNGNYQ